MQNLRGFPPAGSRVAFRGLSGVVFGMVEAVVCMVLVSFVVAGWAFAYFARKVFAQRRRAGIEENSFLASLFTDPPPARATTPSEELLPKSEGATPPR